MARPFIPWVGNKERLLPYIYEILPKNVSQFVEPFGGSGALILSLEPSSKRMDIYNDLDGDLVNLFLCARDRPLELRQELGLLPLQSREEFELLRDRMQHRELFTQSIEAELTLLRNRRLFTEEQAAELGQIISERRDRYDVIRAAAYCKRLWSSFSGTGSSFGVKRVDIDRVIARVKQAEQRLKGIVIEHKDAIDLIAERDRKDGVIYCDPPYYMSEGQYSTDFRNSHVRLWKQLKACKGYVIVSYGDFPYIRNLYKDFYILAFERHNSMSQTAGEQFTELLITNFDPREVANQLALFGENNIGGMRLVRAPRKPLKEIN